MSILRGDDARSGNGYFTMADPRRRQDALPLSVPIRSFSCSFRQKICEIVGWRTTLMSRRPLWEIYLFRLAVTMRYVCVDRVSSRLNEWKRENEIFFAVLRQLA